MGKQRYREASAVGFNERPHVSEGCLRPESDRSQRRRAIGEVGARMGAGSWALQVLHYYLQKNNYNITGPGLLHAEQMRLACNVYSW